MEKFGNCTIPELWGFVRSKDVAVAEKAFSELYLRYVPVVLANLGRHLGQPGLQDAMAVEDFVQDQFIWIWENRLSFSPEKWFERWFFRSAKNRWISAWRRHNRVKWAAWDRETRTLLELEVEMTFLYQVNQLSLDRIQRMIQPSLSEEEQEVFAQLLNGLKPKEIAEELEMPRRKVYDHLYQIRSKSRAMKQQMETEY
ncbi:MAG: sigma-70 family RNA polymerase sigma factor [Bacteroidota bacterium]